MEEDRPWPREHLVTAECPGNHHQGLLVLLGTEGTTGGGRPSSALFTGVRGAQALEMRTECPPLLCLLLTPCTRAIFTGDWHKAHAGFLPQPCTPLCRLGTSCYQSARDPGKECQGQPGFTVLVLGGVVLSPIPQLAPHSESSWSPEYREL